MTEKGNRNYKYCFVPGCSSTSYTCPKKIFFSVPRNEKMRRKWLSISRRDLHKSPLSPRTHLYCCEDHFDLEHDMANYRHYITYKELGNRTLALLKPGIMPHKFQCQTVRRVTLPKPRHTVLDKLKYQESVKVSFSSSSFSVSSEDTEVFTEEMCEEPQELGPITGVSDSDVFIKVEKQDEIEPSSEPEIDEEEDSFFDSGVQIHVKKEEVCDTYSDTSYDIIVKEEREDDPEPAIPAGHLQHQEGSFFICAGLIPQLAGEGFIPDQGGLGEVKEEEEMIIPEDGVQHSLQKLQGTNKSASKTNKDLKKVSNPNLKRNRKVKKYQCLHCDFATADIISLEEHVNARNMSEEPHKCPPYGEVTEESNGREEKPSRRDENRLECPNCEYKAAYPSKLKLHIMACHTGEKPHQCPYCNYTAVQSYNVKTHIMARHAGEKPHKCPHCDYTALKHYSVRIHIMARHTGEKPQKCPHCDYKSVTISCLKKHIISRHMGERPLKCPHCDYKSITSNCLKEHIMARHLREKPYKCPHCDYRATQKSNLKSHIRFLHKDMKD